MMKLPMRTTFRTFLYVMLLGCLTLGAALIAPTAVRADNNKNHKKQHYKRYYDRNGRDYHEWNENENRAYRVYLQENHREYREFRIVRRPQRQEYFGWRHSHPDTTLFKVEIR